MKMTAVKSSAVSHVGYEGGTLHVTYKGGGTYIYPDVPEEIHARMMDGRSIGQYLNSIRQLYPGHPAPKPAVKKAAK